MGGKIEEHYRRRHARSEALHQRARQHFPGGITHDGRATEPFPLFIERASGAYKWDADGNRLIDYWQGHGSLLMGHGYGPVVEALQVQATRGTHYGGSHMLEVHWAEQVKRCFPHIEQLRFTSSGTEATMLAVRLARAYTGKPVVLRLAGHFHGWHDMLAAGAEPDSARAPGVLPEVLAATLVVPAEINAIADAVRQHNNLAALILEPSGATYGAQPLPDSFCREARNLCTRHGLLLILDEVVTGFRIAPGGVQERAGVEADLTCLAKILAGGLPGGAVGGRAAIMRLLEFGDRAWNEERKVRHQGTFNANPLSAVAGITMLKEARNGTSQARASALAGQLREGLNRELRARNLRGCAAYGDASIVHLVLGSPAGFPPGQLPPDRPLAELKAGVPLHLRTPFRLAMLNYGVDLMRGRSAFVSAAHSEDDIKATFNSFGAALDLVKDERELL